MLCTLARKVGIEGREGGIRGERRYGWRERDSEGIGELRRGGGREKGEMDGEIDSEGMGEGGEEGGRKERRMERQIQRRRERRPIGIKASRQESETVWGIAQAH